MTVPTPLQIPFNLMYLAYRATGLALFASRELVASFAPGALAPLEHHIRWQDSAAA